MSDDAEMVKAAAQGVTEGLLAPWPDLLSRLLGGAADEGGLILRDLVRSHGNAIRERILRLFGRTDQMLGEMGVEPKKVPLKLLKPIIDNASIEEDDELQDRWAALLANNAAGNYLEIVFPEILRQLSAADAYLLRMCFHETFWTYNRFAPPWTNPIKQSIAKWEQGNRDRWGPSPPTFPVSELSIDNLLRLGLMTRSVFSEVPEEYLYSLSRVGFHFISACEDPALISRAGIERTRGEKPQFDDLP